MSGTVQIDAQELAQLRKLGQLLGTAWNDPEDGMTVQRIVKKHQPDIQTMDDNPIVRAANKRLEETTEKYTALETAFNEFKSKAELKEQESAIRKQLGDVQTKRGLTDEGMTKVIELMQERKLADPDAAALLYLDSVPKAPPVAGNNKYFESNRLNLFGTTSKDDAWEKLHTDQEGFFADVVNQVFAEDPPGGA